MGRRSIADDLAGLVNRRWTEEEARRVLRAHAKSGKSVLAFAEEHGLVAERVYRWRRRLDDMRERAEVEMGQDVEFVPVVVTNGRGPTALVRADGIEIEVADPSSVPPEWIASVLNHVRGR